MYKKKKGRKTMENLHLKNLDLTKINKKMKNNKVKRKVIQKIYDGDFESKSSKRDKRQKIIRNIIFIPTALLFSYFYLSNLETIKDTIVTILKSWFSY
jgi:hypothetical protein